MPEFFLELFSEEIPARMQAGAAEELYRRVSNLLTLQPQEVKIWFGPRRIAVSAQLSAESSPVDEEVRGPRLSAPIIALEGFLRKQGANRSELFENNGFYILRRRLEPEPASEVIKLMLVGPLSTMPWPKAMRWGQSGHFTWVRPLRRIVCLFDGEVVPIKIGPLTASNLSEGHRLLAPGAFKVTGAAQWETELRQRRVVADAGLRRAMIAVEMQREAHGRGLSIVMDNDLLDEVTGLVEYPVPSIGRIDARFMSLPSEVRELSMKRNQRYFATRNVAGHVAPYFAFVANIEASDGGAMIVKGNELVLRARLADAEHFYNIDRAHSLNFYLDRLKNVIFHAKIGTQYERSQRIAKLAGEISEWVGLTLTENRLAQRAGLLCKADLVTQMVYEFPELQGIVGSYYADDPQIAEAIRTHYQPRGPSDEVPTDEIACVVALADKIDTLIEFFKIGEKPTGSGDPYALRRAALGIIRIILERNLNVSLLHLLNDDVFNFIIERLKVKLKSEGRRYDVLNALFESIIIGDLNILLNSVSKLEFFLESSDGKDVIDNYRRISNVIPVQFEISAQKCYFVDERLLVLPSEEQLFEHYVHLCGEIERALLGSGVLEDAFAALTRICPAIKHFFEEVTVNVDDPKLRFNRLNLLAKLRNLMHRVADFSKLEG